jgi:hypothetical protein
MPQWPGLLSAREHGRNMSPPCPCKFPLTVNLCWGRLIVPACSLRLCLPNPPSFQGLSQTCTAIEGPPCLFLPLPPVSITGISSICLCTSTPILALASWRILLTGFADCNGMNVAILKLFCVYHRIKQMNKYIGIVRTRVLTAEGRANME